MGLVGTPYRVAYEAKAFRSGLTDIVGHVLRPDGSQAGPYSLTEMPSPFVGRYYFDLITIDTDPAGEYFAVILSPTEGIQSTQRMSIYPDLSNILTTVADEIKSASELMAISVL